VTTPDPIIVSYSELDTFRQCPLKHLLAYKHRFKKPVEEMSALSKGSLWHLVMETHYNVIREDQEARGGKIVPLRSEQVLLRKAREAAYVHLFREDKSQSEQQVLIQWMYEGYVEQYGADRQWRILGVELAREFELIPAAERETIIEYGEIETFHAPQVRIKMKLDLLIRDVQRGTVWIVDHKSGANLPSQMDLEIDDQFGLYSWGMTKDGYKVTGSIHNAARTTRNLADHPDYAGKAKPQTLEQRMGRTYLNRSADELVNIGNDAAAAATVAYHAELGYEELPIYSSPDPRQCGWKCDFKEAHLMARQGRPLDLALTERGFVQDFTRH
jgi:hypothetical protein